jgi:outer membrane protein assembly factor BamD (BamD/ComL family)
LIASRTRLCEEIQSALADERVASSYGDETARSEAQQRLDDLLSRYPRTRTQED